MILSDDELQHIENYLDQGVSELEGNFDVAFVFGTKAPEAAELAAELMRRERVRYTLLTGGLNRSTGKIDSQEHLEVMKAAGAPLERILVEGRSKNTHENVCFGLDKLWSVFRYREVKRMVAITKWYHSRRALMALKKQLPKEIEVVALTYEPESCPRATWHSQSESMWLVMKEWKTIPQYLEIGHLAEL